VISRDYLTALWETLTALWTTHCSTLSETRKHDADCKKKGVVLEPFVLELTGEGAGALRQGRQLAPWPGSELLPGSTKTFRVLGRLGAKDARDGRAVLGRFTKDDVYIGSGGGALDGVLQPDHHDEEGFAGGLVTERRLSAGYSIYKASLG
jgi:hypothetical protein